MGREDRAADGKCQGEIRFKRIIDQSLIDGISHPARAHILVTLNERIASPSEIAEETGVDVKFLNYHFEELEKKGFIELVETRRVRGATKHFYKAKRKFLLEGDDWVRLPASVKSDVCASSLDEIREEVARAVAGGTFSARDEMHLSWAPVPVDEKGLADLDALLCETLERTSIIGQASAKRMASSKEAAISTMVVMMSFETCPETSEPPAKSRATP